MPDSAALRVQDVRAAFRLLGDCRDAGNTPARWQSVAMSGLCRLVGAVAATGGEGWWRRRRGLVEPVTCQSHGLTAKDDRRLHVYMREFGVNADPIYQRLHGASGRLVTRRRRQLVSDRDWYQSTAFNEYRRLCNVDHQLTSMFQVASNGATSCVAVHREIRDRDFSDRECALVSFFHAELGRLLGRSLSSALHDESKVLSPRLQQTLAYLMEGDSEKQVAWRMGLSRATVHQYVTMLYRRYGVQSRAELLVRVLNTPKPGTP